MKPFTFFQLLCHPQTILRCRHGGSVEPPQTTMDPAVSNDPWPRKSIGNVQLCLPPGPITAESPEEARQTDRKAGGPITMPSDMVKQATSHRLPGTGATDRQPRQRRPAIGRKPGRHATLADGHGRAPPRQFHLSAGRIGRRLGHERSRPLSAPARLG
ncbi:MAG TPA: hypothetical protein VNS79_08335 [Sphingobium sp.]|nr:hypothetical protein [Sphingobium sp.]